MPSGSWRPTRTAPPRCPVTIPPSRARLEPGLPGVHLLAGRQKQGDSVEPRERLRAARIVAERNPAGQTVVGQRHAAQTHPPRRTGTRSTTKRGALANRQRSRGGTSYCVVGGPAAGRNKMYDSKRVRIHAHARADRSQLDHRLVLSSTLAHLPHKGTTWRRGTCGSTVGRVGRPTRAVASGGAPRPGFEPFQPAFGARQGAPQDG